MDDGNDIIRMVRDSADALGSRGDLAGVRALRFSGQSFDRAVWQQMAQMGWNGLLVSEADGGLELGMPALAAIAEELGARLVAEPLLETAVIAPLLQGEQLAAALAGEKIVLPAWQTSPQALEFGLAGLAQASTVSGTAMAVRGGDLADGYVLLGSDGAVQVERDAPGLTVSTSELQDGSLAAQLTLAGTPVHALPVEPATVRQVIDRGAMLSAAYLLGLTEQAFAMTVDHLKTRQQFGKIIGTFQALQHRCTDLAVQIALTRASVDQAVASLETDAGSTPTAIAVSRAKARAADTALFVTRGAIQLHGGIGYTDEHDIGLYLRKTLVLMNAYGSSAEHRRRYGNLHYAAILNG